MKSPDLFAAMGTALAVIEHKRYGGSGGSVDITTDKHSYIPRIRFNVPISVIIDGRAAHNGYIYIHTVYTSHATHIEQFPPLKNCWAILSSFTV